MAEVVLFHHVQGLTDGVRAFAEELRAGGHTVHTPDLFDGERPATIDDGIAFVDGIGARRSTSASTGPSPGCPPALVYGGFSLGSPRRSGSPRPGRARAARCCTRRASRSPATGLRPVAGWRRRADPRHGQDPFFALEGDLDAARELVERSAPPGRPVPDPATGTCSTTARSPSYDPGAGSSRCCGTPGAPRRLG